ncbi:hypothetical protein AAL_04320 [Moelleriella libera RCEF 2490]|uniref:Uncharacterized protein n=1 Tax=Moelleriella libera RCEF 2490 TaxID=1081109 RepID=A0A168C1D4_9HYPO|nr:hypothetical protein AAL_04320 [Moelleriella libera RCEF 2490]
MQYFGATADESRVQKSRDSEIEFSGRSAESDASNLFPAQSGAAGKLAKGVLAQCQDGRVNLPKKVPSDWAID